MADIVYDQNLDPYEDPVDCNKRKVPSYYRRHHPRRHSFVSTGWVRWDGDRWAYVDPLTDAVLDAKLKHKGADT
jgi:hypothetical protein